MSRFQTVPAKRRRVHEHPLSPGGTTYALLDTNVLLPARLSDMLFDCASQGLFLPRWTQTIQDEFVDNWGDLVFNVENSDRRTRKKAKLPPPANHVAGAQRRLSCFRGAVGVEWEIVGYGDQDILDRVPKKVDRTDIPHVSACLVLLDSLSEETTPSKIFLVSNNLKDLSVRECKSLGIEVIPPGRFLDNLMAAAPSRVESALKKSIADLKGFSEKDLLGVLKVHKATKTALQLSKEWNVPMGNELMP